jgi:tetratricopeptide (TPR) repeat protein
MNDKIKISDNNELKSTEQRLQKLLEQADTKLSHEARIEQALKKLEKQESELKTTNKFLLKQVYDKKILENGYVDNYVAWTSMILALLVALFGFFGNKLVQKYLKDRVDEKIDAKITEALKPIQQQTNKNEVEIKQVEEEQKKAAEIQKKDSELNFNLSLAKTTQEKIEILTKAINTETDANYLATLHHRRGYWHGDLGELENAIADYNKAIELNHQNADSYCNRGVTYGKLEKYELALEDFNQAIKLNPQDANSYYDRGVTYNKLGKYDLAMADYSKAIELNPQHANSYYNLAVYIYAAMQNEQQTIVELELAIKWDKSLREHAKNDTFFKPLHGNPAFRKLVGLDD